MRILKVFTIMFFAFCSMGAVQAEQSRNCAQDCRTQQKACLKNYSAATCNTDYGICIKACQRK